MRKIYFVFPFAIVGGIETLFATLLKHLPKDEGFEYGAFIPDGIKPWADAVVGKHTLVCYYNDAAALAILIDLVKPDLCVAAFSYALAGAIERANHKPKVLETSHNLYHSVGESIRAVAPWIVHVTAVSKSVHDNVKRSMPTTLKVDTSIIVSGVDTAIYRPKSELRKVCKHYAYFGRLSDPEKGILYMLDAFRKLNDKNIFLNLYGKALAGDKCDYRRLVANRYKNTNICLKGFVNNVEDYYHHNDVVTVRSPLEGFCNTVVEAMACGVPIVAFNFHGVLDHLPERTCLIAHDQNSYVQMLFDIQSYKMRKELSENALNYVKKELSATRMAAQYTTLFKKLLLPPTAPAVKSPELTAPAVSVPKPTASAVRIAGICSQYSVSIEHAMSELGADPIKCIYSQSAPKALFDVKEIAANIKSKYDVVIFNAACPGYTELVKELQGFVKIYALYHSGFCGFAFDNLFDANERANLQTMLDWAKEGLIKKVGFVNRGSADYYQSLGFPAAWLPNVPNCATTCCTNNLFKDGKIHIGVFSRLNPMKNTMSALAAALSVPNSIVHVIDKPQWLPPGLADKAGNIVVHGWLSKEALSDAMSRMHVNLMLSFTESYGLLVTESWAVGTPCIVGPSCKPLIDEIEQNYMLSQYMYVERMDDAKDIVDKINLCITYRDRVSEMCKDRVKLLRSVGLQKLQEFIRE
jgi:glycosyltransferase involved in cell wall biosynthesis